MRLLCNMFLNNFFVAEKEPEGIHLFIPKIDEIFWSSLVIVIIALVMMKFVMPKLTTILDERSKKIEGQIEEATSVNIQAKELKQQYKQMLADATVRSLEIKNEAKREAAKIIDDAKNQAAIKSQEIIDNAYIQIEMQRKQVSNNLEKELSLLAISLSEKIVSSSLESDDKQSDLIDKFLTDLKI